MFAKKWRVMMHSAVGSSLEPDHAKFSKFTVCGTEEGTNYQHLGYDTRRQHETIRERLNANFKPSAKGHILQCKVQLNG